MYAKESIDLLTECGIQFKKHEDEGIDVVQFAELLMTSGVILSNSVKWISFHRCVCACRRACGRECLQRVRLRSHSLGRRKDDCADREFFVWQNPRLARCSGTVSMDPEVVRGEYYEWSPDKYQIQKTSRWRPSEASSCSCTGFIVDVGTFWSFHEGNGNLLWKPAECMPVTV